MESITRMIGIDYMAENNPPPGGRDRIVMEGAAQREGWAGGGSGPYGREPRPAGHRRMAVGWASVRIAASVPPST